MTGAAEAGPVVAKKIAAGEAAVDAATNAAAAAAQGPDLTLIVGGVAVVAILLLIMMGGGNKNNSVSKRLERVSGKRAPNRKRREEPLSVRRSFEASAIPMFDQFLKNGLPRIEKLRARLERTGKKITIGSYLLITGLLIMVGFFVTQHVAHQTVGTSALFGIAVGVLLPHLVIGFMGDRRVKKFLQYFPEAIDTMCRGLRSGLPVTESMAAVGREMPEPVGVEFRRITDAVRIGQSLDDAMWEVAARINTPEFRFLIISMSIQRETGGNLAETLANLAELIRRRRQLKLKIRAMSAEARASAMIIGALPFVMFIILFVVSRDYVSALITTKAGNNLVFFGLGLMAVGHGVIAKMIRFDF
ncbi:MAG: pilus assembly protein TadB [Alphaproteobacteria bacterium]|nr:pilus assembly protein TadB [Alphaproteobacteria bacterium]